MKHRFSRLLLGTTFALLSLPSALRADIVVMKDGTRYEEAKITSETPETVTFSYVFKKKFPDTRTEPKANIAEIIKQKPEATEVLPLLKLVPSADLLTADKYESLIQDTLRPFLTKYPGTPESKQVEDIIKTLQTEKEKVVGGFVKIEGEWISPELAKRNPRNIDAYRIRRDVKLLAAENKHKEALNEWTKMIDTTAGFTDTMQYVKSVPEVIAILEAYKKQLDSMITAQPELEKRRKDGLTKMIDSDPIKARTQHAIEAETSAFKSTLDSEKKSHVKWLSVYKYDLKSLQDAAKAVINELGRLRTLDLAKITTVNEAVAAAQTFVAAGSLEEANAALKRATTVQGVRPSQAIVSAITKDISALQKVQSDKLKAQKNFKASSAALTNGGAGDKDSRVSEALEKMEKDKADKKAAKENKAAGGDASEDEKPSKTKTTKKASETKPKAKSDTAAAAPAAEEGGMQTYLVAGGGGLLAILLAVLFFQKKKS